MYSSITSVIVWFLLLGMVCLLSSNVMQWSVEFLSLVWLWELSPLSHPHQRNWRDPHRWLCLMLSTTRHIQVTFWSHLCRFCQVNARFWLAATSAPQIFASPKLVRHKIKISLLNGGSIEHPHEHCQTGKALFVVHFLVFLPHGDKVVFFAKARTQCGQLFWDKFCWTELEYFCPTELVPKQFVLSKLYG